jgi:hypothetical protein
LTFKQRLGPDQACTKVHSNPIAWILSCRNWTNYFSNKQLARMLILEPNLRSRVSSFGRIIKIHTATLPMCICMYTLLCKFKKLFYCQLK